MADNVVTALLRPGGVTTTRPLFQYNQGMVLRLTGIELPETFRADFALNNAQESKPVFGHGNEVQIPYEYFVPGSMINCWIVVNGEDYTVTKYHIVIPVEQRARPGDEEPTPEQQSAIDQAIAALNDGVQRAEAAANGIETAVSDALTAAMESGEFDGPPGKDGKDGQDGKDGTDGYTPVKGIDYFDGQDGAPGKDGKDGQDGQPGRDGEDGEPGKDGVSPSITVTDITGGHRVTITDATGAHSFDVMNGADGAGAVQDVQVNGVSVLSDGVANVPIASDSGLGVVKLAAASSLRGVKIDDYGNLFIQAAALAQIKTAGTSHGYVPIVPTHQHESTFYGLAKAAGDTTQSASSNALGAYTDAAKSAILTMLGVAGIIGNAEGNTASKAYAVGAAFLYAGALYKATAAIAANDAIVPGTNCEHTTILDLLQEE